ncbi:unnamed protein product [marine sediment metagenome]|uniref:Uncharacterized protein n=1 Tax=marine sediment metagenome TaxID=412755 RepID=X0SHW0_9ZZZZ
MYLCLISFIPILISLSLIPGYSFELSLMIIVLTPVYFIFMLITLKYIRKDIIAHSARMGRMTARTGFIILAVVPIAILLLAPIAGFVIDFLGFELTVFILWGISSIINITAAILYKTPQKKQEAS